jgi:hypothetical protein
VVTDVHAQLPADVAHAIHAYETADGSGLTNMDRWHERRAAQAALRHAVDAGVLTMVQAADHGAFPGPNPALHQASTNVRSAL